MDAIQTRFIPLTKTKGARIRAFSHAFPRGVVVSYGYSEMTLEHDLALKAFLNGPGKGWPAEWVRGGSVDGRGFVYVNSTGR